MYQILLVLLLLISPCLAATKPTLPDKVELNVPFLCQAPNGNWDQPYQDACEEAAIIMAMHYLNGKPLDKDIGNQEIIKLVAFQNKKYGGHHDLTAKSAGKLMKDYYKFTDFTRLYSFEVETIKAALAKGDIVIAPAAGRLLKNRYFKQPGPAYHYLVFKGYDERQKEFITNDPGTKRGYGFRYSYENAYDSLHDWTGSKETIAKGRKAIIIIHKSQ